MMANHLCSYTVGLKFHRIHTCHGTLDLLVVMAQEMVTMDLNFIGVSNLFDVAFALVPGNFSCWTKRLC